MNNFLCGGRACNEVSYDWSKDEWFIVEQGNGMAKFFCSPKCATEWMSSVHTSTTL